MSRQAIDAWAALPAAAARSLELAHCALVAGGLPVGSVITDRSGGIVAEGRNRAYDDATGADCLERTPIAHAEMNAMARVDIDAETDQLTLWSTQLPCSMCRAAIDFIGIGTVISISTDPSAPHALAHESLSDVWVVLATAMFLAGPLRRSGPDHPSVEANRTLEPEAVTLAEQTASEEHPLVDGRSLQDGVVAMWDDLQSAATHRRQRIERALCRFS